MLLAVFVSGRSPDNGHRVRLQPDRARRRDQGDRHRLAGGHRADGAVQDRATGAGALRYVVAETNVFPAGIGSATSTPVAVLGPLFVTTIVQVMLPSDPAPGRRRARLRDREVDHGLDTGRSARLVACRRCVVVTLPVLLTTPVSGQSPPVAPVVVGGDVHRERRARPGSSPRAPSPGRRSATPAVIAQVPVPTRTLRMRSTRTDPDSSAACRSSVTPCASPVPSFQTVIVKPIGSPAFTCAASAVFTIWIAGAATQIVGASTRPSRRSSSSHDRCCRPDRCSPRRHRRSQPSSSR